MTPHKSLFDLSDDTLLSGAWQIDGQAVAGIEILDRGEEAIEHLAVLAENGKTYTIKGHANLMEDDGEHAWAGWVMELGQRRQVYLQIVADAPIGAQAMTATPGSEETPSTASSPWPEEAITTVEEADEVGVLAASHPEISVETIEAEAAAVNTPSLDDMLLVTFSSDDGSVSSPGAASTEHATTPQKVRKARQRMSQKHFDLFLMTWPLAFFVAFIFFIVSLCVATETEPMGRWPWLTWVTFGMIGVGYLGMWYGPREAATGSGATHEPPPNTRIDG